MSKLDQLRKGEVVEFKPGLYGRLNMKDKTLEFSDGMKIDVSQDSDCFPKNAHELSLSREKEKIYKEISSSFLGNFGYQIGETWPFVYIKDLTLFLTLGKDGFSISNEARLVITEEISAIHPNLSFAASAVNLSLGLWLGWVVWKKIRWLFLGNAVNQ